MEPSSSVRRSFQEGDAILALDRALNWTAATPLPWQSIAGSLAMHVFVVTLAMATFAGLHGTAPATPARPPRAPAFMPLVYYAPPLPPPVVLAVGGRLAAPPIELPEGASPEVAVNLNSVKLSFALDVRNQLPGVVLTQHGTLALLDKTDLAIARYLIEPPLWEPLATVKDLSRSLRFRMDPAAKWPVFRETADRFGIDLNQFIACAVFDAAFGRCLKAAIRRSIPPGAMGAVSSVHLAFNADCACGIEVLKVQLARQPVPQP